VCLGVLQTERNVQEAVAANEQRFLAATGWRPTVTKRVAGALMYTRYNWLKRWVMKKIAGKAGGDTDTRRDYEYTDWSDVRAFAERFGELVRRSVTTAGASPTAVDSAQELLPALQGRDG